MPRRVAARPLRQLLWVERGLHAVVLRSPRRQAGLRRPPGPQPGPARRASRSGRVGHARRCHAARRHRRDHRQPVESRGLRGLLEAAGRDCQGAARRLVLHRRSRSARRRRRALRGRPRRRHGDHRRRKRVSGGGRKRACSRAFCWPRSRRRHAGRSLGSEARRLRGARAGAAECASPRRAL